MYHVGRPGHDGYMDRVLQAWGVDGHNSHTNVCSSGARLGYTTWVGADRPSPDHTNARFILMLSAWLTDKSQPHYFSSRFLVLKAETGLATHGILLFRCHRGFGVRFTA